MRTLMIAGALLVMASTAGAWQSDPPPQSTVKAPPEEIKVKVVIPEGMSDQEVAAGIAAENARRDPAAQEAARTTKQKNDADAAHHERVSKICDQISEKSLADDPSLRRMCGE